MFKKKKITPSVCFDPEKQIAIIKCSICNGEQVAGFKDKRTGQFNEVMLIKDEKDVKTFTELYHLKSVSKEY